MYFIINFAVITVIFTVFIIQCSTKGCYLKESINILNLKNNIPTSFLGHTIKKFVISFRLLNFSTLGCSPNSLRGNTALCLMLSYLIFICRMYISRFGKKVGSWKIFVSNVLMLIKVKKMILSYYP